jgi:hypothetical protein
MIAVIYLKSDETNKNAALVAERICPGGFTKLLQKAFSTVDLIVNDALTGSILFSLQDTVQYGEERFICSG